jgi:proteasome accessory factor A
MGIPKAAGIETEYGIFIWGAEDFSPFAASQRVLNAYQRVGGPSIPTGLYYNPQTGDIQDEADEDAAPDETGASPKTQTVYYGLGSLMLANGSRFYIDHAHPEYCTAETLSARGVVAADRAGERIVARCAAQVNRNGSLPDGQQVAIYKNNSDQKGNSYGCHENYLLSMTLFEDLLRRRSHIIYRTLLPFLISRVIVCGAGKVGYENNTDRATFQLSQRADFFETLMGLQTTYQRPLFNIRDEPHTDSTEFRRLHVILGDANMAEISTYLKIGTTQLVLSMIEDEFIKADLTLAYPIDAFQQVSRDLTFRQPLPLESGQQMTALDIQEFYLEQAEKYLDDGTDEQWDVWDRWADALDALRDGQGQALANRLDWAIKKNVLDRYLAGQQTDWETVARWQPIIEGAVKTGDLRTAETVAIHAGLTWGEYEQQRDIYFTLRRLDLEYHDTRHEGTQAGLFYRLQNGGLVERLLTDAEIDARIQSPPPDTRAWLRGKIVERFNRQIVGADWSYIKLQYADPTATLVYRLEFPNPLLGTEADLAPVWDRLKTPEQMFRYFTGESL